VVCCVEFWQFDAAGAAFWLMCTCAVFPFIIIFGETWPFGNLFVQSPGPGHSGPKLECSVFRGSLYEILFKQVTWYYIIEVVDC